MRLLTLTTAAVLLFACPDLSAAPAEPAHEKWLGGCGVDADAVLRAAATTDSDGDGVNDALDDCPFGGACEPGGRRE